MRPETTGRLSGETATRLGLVLSAPQPDDSALRAAVCSYVDEMRRRGVAVEEIIVEIKRIAAETLASLPQDSRDRPTPSAHAQMVNRAVTWCIEHYYWTT